MQGGVTAAAGNGRGDGRVVLRPVQDDDFAALAALRRDAQVQALLLSSPEATDDQAIHAWIERRCTDAGGGFQVIAEAQSLEPVGYAQVSQVHRRNRNGYYGIALARAAWGRGFGRAALWQLVDYAARDLGLLKMLAEVRADNEISLKMNYAVGFRPVGTMAAHVHDRDGAHDVMLLERHLTDGGS